MASFYEETECPSDDEHMLTAEERIAKYQEGLKEREKIKVLLTLSVRSGKTQSQQVA